MADITTLLNKIKNTIYGSEMREHIHDAINAVNNDVETREPKLTNGAVSQYFRGNKTLSTFASDVRSTVLTGLLTTVNTAVSAADSILSAIGKLQVQINVMRNEANKEVSARETAINTLTQSLTDETTSRVNAIDFLRKSIDEVGESVENLKINIYKLSDIYDSTVYAFDTSKLPSQKWFVLENDLDNDYSELQEYNDEISTSLSAPIAKGERRLCMKTEDYAGSGAAVRAGYIAVIGFDECKLDTKLDKTQYASTSQAGVMSSEDKAKIDAVITGSTDVSGAYDVHVSGELSAPDIRDVYSIGFTDNKTVQSLELKDVSKLKGIEDGAQKHLAPTKTEITAALGFVPASEDDLDDHLTAYDELYDRCSFVGKCDTGNSEAEKIITVKGLGTGENIPDGTKISVIFSHGLCGVGDDKIVYFNVNDAKYPFTLNGLDAFMEKTDMCVTDNQGCIPVIFSKEKEMWVYNGACGVYHADYARMAGSVAQGVVTAESLSSDLRAIIDNTGNADSLPMTKITEERDVNLLTDTGMYLLKNPQNAPYTSSCVLFVARPRVGVLSLDGSFKAVQTIMFEDKTEVYIRTYAYDGDEMLGEWSEWVRVGGNTYAEATQTTAGLMSAEDKTKIDEFNFEDSMLNGWNSNGYYGIGELTQAVNDNKQNIQNNTSDLEALILKLFRIVINEIKVSSDIANSTNNYTSTMNITTDKMLIMDGTKYYQFFDIDSLDAVTKIDNKAPSSPLYIYINGVAFCDSQGNPEFSGAYARSFINSLRAIDGDKYLAYDVNGGYYKAVGFNEMLK